MSFQVVISRRAAGEIAERYRRMTAWATPATTNRWRNALLAAVDTLEELPRRCPEAPEAEWMGGEVRELLHGKRRNVHRVLFRIVGDTVIILHVRSAREDFLRPDDN